MTPSMEYVWGGCANEHKKDLRIAHELHEATHIMFARLFRELQKKWVFDNRSESLQAKCGSSFVKIILGLNL